MQSLLQKSVDESYPVPFAQLDWPRSSWGPITALHTHCEGVLCVYVVKLGFYIRKLTQGWWSHREKHMYAHKHMCTHTPLIPRVPDVWPQIPSPPGWNKTTYTHSHTHKQRPNCDRQCGGVAWNSPRGSFHLADAFQPVPSVTVSHVGSGRNYKESPRCDHICSYLPHCPPVCESTRACRALSLCSGDNSKSGWNTEREKEQGAEKVHYHFAWLMIFHLGGRQSTWKINQWGVLIWDTEERNWCSSRG